MARTLVQIKREMEKLEKEAERVKASEVAGVVQRIKIAIEFYGLTKGDLFGSKTAGPTKGKKAIGRPKKAKKSPAPAKYKDKETGRTWTGHGKRPQWFVKAIEAGMKAEEIAI